MKARVAALFVALAAVAATASVDQHAASVAINSMLRELDLRIAPARWPGEGSCAGCLVWSADGDLELHALFHGDETHGRYEPAPCRWQLVDADGAIALDPRTGLLRAQVHAAPGASATLVATTRRDGVLHRAWLRLRFDGAVGTETRERAQRLQLADVRRP